MKICFEALPLKSEVRELAMKFPECAGFHAREGQAKEIDRFIREMDRWILQMEEEEKSKNKVIMSLGIAAGIFLIVILL